VVPLHKLARLPRHQRLRKIAKLLEAEDLRAARGRDTAFSDSRDGYLADIARLLASDAEFPPDAAEALRASFEDLSSRRESGIAYERRSINALRHIVGAAVGKQIAYWDLVDDAGRLSSDERTTLVGVRVYLEDLRSPFNVGSIFRAAESFGGERGYLSPLCAATDHPRASRSSMGCDKLVPWERERLEEISGPVFALETGGVPLDEFQFPERGTLIVGSEELGVSPAALAAAERSAGRVSIPTIGAKGSLNVAVAFGIAMREWCRRLTCRGSSPS